MVIKGRCIERIVITGTYEESHQAFDYCARGDYRIIRSGPEQIGSMKYDASRFRIIAERDVEEQPCTPQ